MSWRQGRVCVVFNSKMLNKIEKLLPSLTYQVSNRKKLHHRCLLELHNFKQRKWKQIVSLQPPADSLATASVWGTREHTTLARALRPHINNYLTPLFHTPPSANSFSTFFHQHLTVHRRPHGTKCHSKISSLIR